MQYSCDKETSRSKDYQKLKCLKNIWEEAERNSESENFWSTLFPKFSVVGPQSMFFSNPEEYSSHLWFGIDLVAANCVKCFVGNLFSFYAWVPQSWPSTSWLTWIGFIPSAQKHLLLYTRNVLREKSRFSWCSPSFTFNSTFEQCFLVNWPFAVREIFLSPLTFNYMHLETWTIYLSCFTGFFEELSASMYCSIYLGNLSTSNELVAQ